MASTIILERFLRKSMIQWKSIKDSPSQPWKFCRCSLCQTPLFGTNTLCVRCFWEEEDKEYHLQMEEEYENTKKCINCGDPSEDGPFQRFCRRRCMVQYGRYD